MPSLRRVPQLLVVGLAAGLLPACLPLRERVNPVATRPAGSGEFAILPSRPGEVIPTNPGARKTSTPESTQPASPPQPIATPSGDPVEGGPRPAAGQTTSRRPNPKAEAGLSEPGPKAEAEPEIPSPPGPVTAVKAEPGPLPVQITPPAPEPPLLAAVRAYIENRPDDAIKHLQSLDKANQDFALTVLPLLIRGSQLNVSTADPNDIAVMVDQFQSIIGRLEGRAALGVDKVAFCRKVAGFGRYEVWPEAQPYRPNDLAVLYVEMRHISCEPATGPNGEGFVSRAVVSLEVRDAGGRLVEQTDPSDWRRRVPVARFEHVDYTRSPLHDYSRTYRISVPAQPGVYTVTVQVKDPVGNRVARSQPTEFRVAGP